MCKYMGDIKYSCVFVIQILINTNANYVTCIIFYK